MTRPAWRIYYRDGRTFDAKDGAWVEAPSEGVLLVVENIDGRITFHMGADHYQLDDCSIVTRDTRTILAGVGLVEMSAVKFGWYTSATKMEETIRRAKQEWEI